MYRTAKEWEDLFKAEKALWAHDGNILRPHAELSSGKHSSGFFNAEILMRNTQIAEEIAANLVDRLKDTQFDLNWIDWVVGPAMGAITLAHNFGRHVGKDRGRSCNFAYTEKVGEGANKKMVFKRSKPNRVDFVLIVEDTVTTAGSAGLVREAVVQCEAIAAPVLSCILNRSVQERFTGFSEVLALVNLPMQDWDSKDCPLCRQGSEAILPKVDGNWERLNAKY